MKTTDPGPSGPGDCDPIYEDEEGQGIPFYLRRFETPAERDQRIVDEGLATLASIGRATLTVADVLAAEMDDDDRTTPIPVETAQDVYDNDPAKVYEESK